MPPAKHPWRVEAGDKQAWFLTFERAETWARKKAIEFVRDGGLSQPVEIYHGFALEVARIRVDGMDRVWTEIVETYGVGDVTGEVLKACRVPVQPELSRV